MCGRIYFGKNKFTLVCKERTLKEKKNGSMTCETHILRRVQTEARVRGSVSKNLTVGHIKRGKSSTSLFSE